LVTSYTTALFIFFSLEMNVNFDSDVGNIEGRKWLLERTETSRLVFKLKKMGNTTVLDPRWVY